MGQLFLRYFQSYSKIGGKANTEQFMIGGTSLGLEVGLSKVVSPSSPYSHFRISPSKTTKVTWKLTVPSLSDQVPRPGTAELHALAAGHLTLPEKFFVHPASNDSRKTVPSLAFLIQHHHPITGKITRIVFDLGLRRDVHRYSEAIQRHVSTREPLTTDPDVTKSLAAGGLSADDIDYIIYSHVHWDHIGEPRDFQKSTFVIGHGTWNLFTPAEASSLRGSHSFFEPGILPEDRTLELKDPDDFYSCEKKAPLSGEANFEQPWTTLPEINMRVLDIFNDGTVNIVHAPGHLPGHINLLIKTSSGAQIYLAGDACHDRRIMRGELEIGEWRDTAGQICCIHADRKKAEETIEKIRQLEISGVEVIFAHDIEWEENMENRSRFWVNNTAQNAIELNLSSESSKNKFIAENGKYAWNDGWESILALSPELFNASLDLRGVPKRPRHRHLTRKTQCLISIAVDSAATHLYAPGVHEHIQTALHEGATTAEIIEVIELTSTLGIHACNIGVPILVEVLREENHPLGLSTAFDVRQEQLKTEFTKNRGYWHTFWEDFLRLDPDFFEAYLKFSSVPWMKKTEHGEKGALEPKVKELIYCAFDAAATHLYVPGLKLHMKNALGYGASPQEIMEVLEIPTALSLHTANVAAPILEKELAKKQTLI
ncbi:carboxymuconolactone decarboxylase [Talaromyces islandicus]|uniref:Carboxymuconolactone decarboxylase n=1 Tax=Talaromyces islandicus TaxID=28573 RepID=A0A0U1LRN0_TALIS|nr:carboxymuconolactone decarboxylase [Talaromyces islandicus]